VAFDLASESTPSDRTQTFTPTPVTLNRVRAVSTAWVRSPSETAAPRPVAGWGAARAPFGGAGSRAVVAPEVRSTRVTSGHAAIVASAATGASTVTVRVFGDG
jgi:hypothetical protein